MDDKMRSGIRRQLEGLARMMLTADDQEAAVGLAETCAALLRTYEKINGAGNLKGDDLEDATDAFRGISRSVRNFADRLHATDDTARMENERMQREISQVQKDLDSQSTDNTAMLKKLMQLKDDYANACARYRRMQEEMDSFYPEAYNSQMEQNRILNGQLEDAQRLMDSAQQEHARLANELDEIKVRISRVNEQIDELPEEIRSLGDEFESRERHLDRLRRAEEEFTPERMAALEDEIAHLENRNAVLEQAVRELKNTRSNLSDTHVQLESEQQRLQSEVLERINACLSGLRDAAGLEKEKVDNIRNEADDLRAQLEECERLRREYAAWLEADESPIETVRAILSRRDPLDAELDRTLDPTKNGRLNELAGSVKQELEEMDRLLKECFAAAGRDRSVISGKVRSIRKA